MKTFKMQNFEKIWSRHTLQGKLNVKSSRIKRNGARWKSRMNLKKKWKSISRFSAIQQIQISSLNRFYFKKIIWKHIQCRIATTVWRKNIPRGPSLLDFITFHKAIVVKNIVVLAQQRGKCRRQTKDMAQKLTLTK